jgi:WD40 repeat protein
VLRIWRLDSDQQVTVLRGHTSYVRGCVYSPDGQWILSAGRDQQIKLWHPETYGESLVLGRYGAGGRDAEGGHVDAVLAARFSRDGSQIVTASRDRTARLWDAKTQKLIGRFEEGHEFLASSAVFYADGTRLATGAGDGTTRLWDVATGTEIKALVGTGRTATLDVSEDGRWIATAGQQNDAQVWDVETGTQVAELHGHEDLVTVVRFAPGGEMLATGDERGRCRIWRRQGDQWVGGPWLVGHSRSISALAFTQQGRRLVSASGDNTCGQ